MGTSISLTKRNILKNKYGNICQICGKEFPDEKLCVEHVVPKFKGGNNDIENLSLACRSCNSLKNNRNAHEFSKEAILRRPDVFTGIIKYEHEHGILEKSAVLDNVVNCIEELEKHLREMKRIEKEIHALKD